MTLRARALEYFVEPRSVAPPDRAFLEPVAPKRAPGRVRPATRLPLRAAVLGAPADAVAAGALLANALRSSAGASAAALAVWAPGGAALRSGPSGLAASRLAARLTARGLAAAPRGRLAVLSLEDHPVAAAVAVRRAAGALDVPLVAVMAGPRCDVIEGVLAEQDLVVVACGEPDGPLARLAVAGCSAAALACAPPPPGPARWLARSCAAGARGLPVPLRSLVRELGRLPEPEPMEVAW